MKRFYTTCDVNQLKGTRPVRKIPEIVNFPDNENNQSESLYDDFLLHIFQHPLSPCVFTGTCISFSNSYVASFWTTSSEGGKSHDECSNLPLTESLPNFDSMMSFLVDRDVPICVCDPLKPKGKTERKSCIAAFPVFSADCLQTDTRIGRVEDELVETECVSADSSKSPSHFLHFSVPPRTGSLSSTSSGHNSPKMRLHSFLTYARDLAIMKSSDSLSSPRIYLKDWHCIEEETGCPETLMSRGRLPVNQTSTRHFYPSVFPFTGGQSVCKPFYTVPLIFCDDWFMFYRAQTLKYRYSGELTDDVNSEIFNSDFRFVYLGPSNSYTSFHMDVLGSFSWSVSLSGYKLWRFFYMLQLPGSTEPQAHFSEHIQRPNEVMFVPSGVYHEVFNLTTCLSVNHNWINGANIMQMADVLRQDFYTTCSLLGNGETRDTAVLRVDVSRIMRANCGIDFYGFYDFLGTMVIWMLHRCVYHKKMLLEAGALEKEASIIELDSTPDREGQKTTDAERGMREIQPGLKEVHKCTEGKEHGNMQFGNHGCGLCGYSIKAADKALPSLLAFCFDLISLYRISLLMHELFVAGFWVRQGAITASESGATVNSFFEHYWITNFESCKAFSVVGSPVGATLVKSIPGGFFIYHNLRQHVAETLKDCGALSPSASAQKGGIFSKTTEQEADIIPTNPITHLDLVHICRGLVTSQRALLKGVCVGHEQSQVSSTADLNLRGYLTYNDHPELEAQAHVQRSSHASWYQAELAGWKFDTWKL